MNKQDGLAEHFNSHRQHLQSLAYRMLGSSNEAEDAVQEAWLRLNRSDAEQINNLQGWLITVVSRICLDQLRARKPAADDVVLDLHIDNQQGPETELLIAYSLGPALLLILDTLSPPERIAFVLHDLFDLSFADIAPIIERSEAATRQLASRARRQVQGASSSRQDDTHQQHLVAAFLQASRQGDFQALLSLLHPDAILRADATALKITKANQAKGAPQFEAEMSGATKVANTLKGRALGAMLSLVDGMPGATWGANGTTMVAFCFGITDGKITHIDVIMDRARLESMDIRPIEQESAEAAQGIQA
ncbi:sigma-70 family RNA polymerase sigma factor [Bowmanella yangjiangensis]|uniref:Sigma-70 family RNA polymerase sigma factor n=1 Tax=Bowmanella yangjiangensis TaxID=2811230 RepID=A0ABS3CPX7_9ALTE|nr:sigma-70 family RNA polymerase sigma factor [Bowmanella yangjiangensis]MBN7818516.1 sigma-70 family RNA polymerase sigma factor [Bowmanella yangjiangensis]